MSFRGGKGRAIKEKIGFFPTAKVLTAMKLNGIGFKALMKLPLKEQLFFAIFLIILVYGKTLSFLNLP